METISYLIRHGVTRANRENRFAGRTAEPLHRDGMEQAEQLGGRLRGCGIKRIFTGPLARTSQTAGIIGRHISAPVAAAEELNDILLPHWDGLTKEEIRQRFGPQYPTWLHRPDAFAVPGCESLAAVQQRAVCFVERVFAGHAGEKSLLVSHLVVLRCLLLHYQGLPLGEYRGIKVANGEVVALVREGGGGTAVVFQGDNGP